MTLRPRCEPMLARPGARFSCEGDGLCCSDVHAIGPLNEEDIVFLSAISEEAIDRHADDDAAVLMMRSDTGTCVFWSERGCALHIKLGPERKPSPCIQFPYSLTATPTGGRIATQHRCPCRTLGTRAPVSADGARSCLLGRRGELKPDHAVEEPIAWSRSESISFRKYERRESAVIESFIDGQSLGRTLAVEPFPTLDGLAWAEVSDELREFHGPSRVATAARWFGDALGYLIDRRERTERDRPWDFSFDRAQRRIVTPEPPNRVFGDWLADEVWALRWTPFGSFAKARAELATRLAVARRIAGWLDISNPKSDNVSAAEAVMIVDVIGSTDSWESVRQAIVEQ